MSSTAFQRWYERLMPWEGTVQDWERIPANQFDRGGLTNGGVTIGTWRTVAPLYGWPSGKTGLRNMTKEQHRRIAYDHYWLASKADKMPGNVGIYHADTAWGSGTGNAGIILQRALRELGQNVAVDGAVGPLTLAAVAAVDSNRLLQEYHRQRAAFLAGIAARDVTQSVFSQGWTNRINDIYNTALEEVKKKSSDTPGTVSGVRGWLRGLQNVWSKIKSTHEDSK